MYTLALLLYTALTQTKTKVKKGHQISQLIKLQTGRFKTMVRNFKENPLRPRPKLHEKMGKILAPIWIQQNAFSRKDGQ